MIDYTLFISKSLILNMSTVVEHIDSIGNSLLSNGCNNHTTELREHSQINQVWDITYDFESDDKFVNDVVSKETYSKIVTIYQKEKMKNK